MSIVKAFKTACGLLFRCTNARTYVVGAAKMFLIAWKAVQPFLEEV
jgi:hypothetical protein